SRDKYFQRFYRAPILAKVMNQLYKLGVPEKNRKDLVSVLLTGVNDPKLNYTGPTLADELRVNLSVPVTPPSDFSRLGVLGGDLQGWPNGRRLGDDVVDIAEQAVPARSSARRCRSATGSTAPTARVCPSSRTRRIPPPATRTRRASRSPPESPSFAAGSPSNRMERSCEQRETHGVREE